MYKREGNFFKLRAKIMSRREERKQKRIKRKIKQRDQGAWAWGMKHIYKKLVNKHII